MSDRMTPEERAFQHDWFTRGAPWCSTCRQPAIGNITYQHASVEFPWGNGLDPEHRIDMLEWHAARDPHRGAPGGPPGPFPPGWVHEPGEEPLSYWEREARRAVAGHTAMSANVLVMHLRDAMVEVDRLRAELVEVQPPGHHVDIVFDGPPGAVSGRFVEVEDETGKSIRLGTWVERADGFWALRITPDQECCRFCTDPHTEGAEPVHTHGEDCCEYIPPGYMIREDPDHGEMLVPITEGDRRA